MRALLAAYRGVLRSYYGQVKERKENPYLLYRFLYRPLSFPLSAVAIRVGVSADALTAINFLVLAAALAALARGQLLLGAWLYFIYYVLDFADGNIARYHGVSSYFGKLVDGMVDTVSYLTFAAAAWGNARAGGSWIGAEAEVFVGVAATVSALLRQNYQWRMSALKSEIRLLSPAQSRPGAEVPMRPVVRLFNNIACSAPLVLLIAAYLDAVSAFLVAFFLLYGFAGNLEIVIGILRNRAVLTARREH
jgi:phosphatidylglycerophosphate synthase